MASQRDKSELNSFFDDSAWLHIDADKRIEAEGCKAIMEYNDRCVILNMGGFSAVIRGEGLELRALTKTSMRIEGQLGDIAFEKRGEAKGG